ncbi:unannotated protein [freshwater metagenome]|uniref:Unannotated protein n=1 Tax=freshwater metagenome TaxID=449393 RepID=A0A6J6K7T8_9ZZZZ|nr:hypothetical protein [Actinomycetota bacterium]MSZ32575.1 hypothetical protein [Actinomycetota bacterium]MTA55775.1 hypothetical protein [Actinomycetota bacterium]MTA56834.1 hypothetical protein [Actinomycetota bacterium]
MNPLNNYRFGSYALLAMGLINLRYQTGTEANLPTSSVLITVGLLVFIATFIPKLSTFLLGKMVKKISLLLLIALIIYGILI